MKATTNFTLKAASCIATFIAMLAIAPRPCAADIIITFHYVPDIQPPPPSHAFGQLIWDETTHLVLPGSTFSVPSVTGTAYSLTGLPGAMGNLGAPVVLGTSGTVVPPDGSLQFAPFQSHGHSHQAWDVIDHTSRLLATGTGTWVEDSVDPPQGDVADNGSN